MPRIAKNKNLIPSTRMSSEPLYLSWFPHHRDRLGFYLVVSSVAAASLCKVGNVLQIPNYNPGDEGVCVWRELFSCSCRHVETQWYKTAMSNRLVIFQRPRQEERMSIAEPLRSPEDWKRRSQEVVTWCLFLSSVAPELKKATAQQGATGGTFIFIHQRSSASRHTCIYCVISLC